VGIRERKGIATSFTDLTAIEADDEILRLESIIRDGLDPRIPGVSTRAVPTPDEDAVVLVIRVPRSFAAPHMVTFRNLARFYTRNSAGKYQLDVSELRTAFSFADSVRTSLRNFRLERLARITANDGPVALLPNPKTVLHLIPMTAIDPSAQVDSASLAQPSVQGFQPIYTGSGWNRRVNFDGALAFSPSRDGESASYTQIFRNGAIEAVEAFMLRREYLEREHLIPSTAFERAVIEAVGLYLGLMRSISLTTPYVLGLSLLDVRGLRMGVKSGFFEEDHEIDRDDLIVPEILIEDDSIAPATIIRPAIDAIWQATGWPGSTNYDENGTWQDR